MRYYDFSIDGRRVGYVEVEETLDQIYMNARMVLEGERHENPFWIRILAGRPTEVRRGEREWQAVPVGTYPTSAYLLVLRAGLSKYRAFDEGSAMVEDREMRNEDDLLVEYVGTKVCRAFRIEDGDVVYISWGGAAESRLCASRTEAVRGTPFE